MWIVTNKYEVEIDFRKAVDYMLEDLKDDLRRELAPCSAQKIFTAYEKLYEELTGEEWRLSKPNPEW